MGISGHMLSEKNVRRLSHRVGIPLTRAYRYGRYGEAVAREGDRCKHYEIDFVEGAATAIPGPEPWASCPPGCNGRASRWA